MTTKRSTRKPRVTAKMRQKRADRLVELGKLFPIRNAPSPPLKRLLFLDFRGEELAIDHCYEDLPEAREGFSLRGDWEFDPNPPPRMVVDLDAEDLAVTALSYNPSEGMQLEHEFALEALIDFQYVPETGHYWSDAYYQAPRVDPAYSPTERAAKLKAWLECDWRDSWEDPDDV